MYDSNTTENGNNRRQSAHRGDMFLIEDAYKEAQNPFIA